MSGQRIHLLDETTINQIAAGEVIENPASVVKELVENALDSGARSITVETKGGGRGLIRVADDGCGMGHDDLILSLERHATSKMTEIEDLNSVGTLGFRGEALPSIASVSKLTIHTADQEEGRRLLAEGGRILNVQAKPRRRGTTVEVRSLFFNVPVRKKFQKSVGWDHSQIHKVLTNTALCHRDIAFSWVADEVEQFALPADTPLQDRIRLLLGEVFADSLLLVEQSKGDLSLTGCTGKLSFHRPNRTGQYLFINNRAVTSPFIARKVLEGYGTRLSIHRFPLFILYLTLPQAQIDVNVHPQKKEVRLRCEAELGAFVTDAIDGAFAPKKEKLISMPASLPSFSAEEPMTLYQPPPRENEPPPELFPSIPKIVSRLGNFLFLEDSEGLRVVDKRAARLRIAFEQLTQKRGKKAVQQLLLPIQFEVTGAEKSALMDSLEVFEEAGFSIRPFGENTFIVDAIPTCFEGDEIQGFVYAYLSEGDLPPERKIASALNKALIQRGGSETLIEALFKCADPDFAPDGKPTHYLLTEKDLTKLFR